jgi:hypothetical protein
MPFEKKLTQVHNINMDFMAAEIALYILTIQNTHTATQNQAVQNRCK